MPVFAYRAVDVAEKRVAGEITADSGALARQQLRSQGLTIARLEPAQRGAAQHQKPGWALRYGARRHEADVAELWRNLATLLDAGIPLTEALQVCLRQQRGRMRSVLRQLHDEVRSGVALSDALARRPAWFDEMTVTITTIGQESGNLAAALRELADYLTRRRAATGRLTTALIYPAILLIVGAGVATFLMSYVIPQLLDVLAAADRPLPRPTLLLKAASDMLGRHGLWLSLFTAAVLAAVFAWSRTPRGARRIERILLAIPRLGDLLRKSWVARLSLMLATLLKAEVRFVAALRTTRDGLPSRLLRDELERLEAAVEAGSGIADPLRHSRILPPMVVSLLAVGQESGELPRMLEQLRISYEREVEVALARFMAILEPALIVTLGLGIGFVAFATLLPILEATRIAM